MNILGKASPARKEADDKARRLAAAIVGMEGSEGWKAFKELAESLAVTMTPRPEEFKAEDAVLYASRMTFVSGIRRCIGLMEQQKEILASLKRPGE